ncbi:MAG: hypothetical protein ACRDDY_08020 [Clostridium sp.]|uniref:hypothetical protein n=1 Tax=Clostridium sp. TaxID=1506 RepID=UPI003EE4A955
MIKSKIIAGVLAASVIGSIAIINAKKIDIDGNLALANKSTTQYVENVNQTLAKSKGVIDNLQEKNQSLQNEVEKLKGQNTELENQNGNLEKSNASLKEDVSNKDNKISTLLNTIAILEGKSNYKNMTGQEQSKIISTLLHYWGYSKRTSDAIADLLNKFSKPWWKGYGTEQQSMNIQKNGEISKQNEVQESQGTNGQNEVQESQGINGQNEVQESQGINRQNELQKSKETNGQSEVQKNGKSNKQNEMEKESNK